MLPCASLKFASECMFGANNEKLIHCHKMRLFEVNNLSSYLKKCDPTLDTSITSKFYMCCSALTFITELDKYGTYEIQVNTSLYIEILV